MQRMTDPSQLTVLKLLCPRVMHLLQNHPCKSHLKNDFIKVFKTKLKQKLIHGQTHQYKTDSLTPVSRQKLILPAPTIGTTITFLTFLVSTVATVKLNLRFNNITRTAHSSSQA
jgi:hypothetical protein